MDVVTKSVDAAVRPVESESPNGQAEVVLSTESLDRDGEHLWIDEWKQPLPDRIHIDGDHGRSLDKTVGSAVPRIEGNKMVGTVDFAGTPYAQMVRQLVNEGHVNKLSVTYAERKNQKDGKPQRELLNAAFVAIPANPEAVVLASKSMKKAGEDAAARFKAAIEAVLKDVGDAGLAAGGNDPAVKHDAMVQAIHDAAYQLGAECANEVAADSGASDGANKSLKINTIQWGNHTLTGNPAGAAGIKLADTEASASKEVGSPQESTEEPTAATANDKAAAAADESADATDTKAKAAKARALAFLIKQSSQED